jgi:glycosyltransferase involved in cell wall biosynthesis
MKKSKDLASPKVSIIMATYNSEKFIKKTLGSFQKDNFGDFEIIVVNDASTDNTKKIVEEISKKDGRIRLINLEKNLGSANARNTGIKLATGEYVGYFDSDDIHLPGRFEKQIGFLEENPDVGFVYSDQITQWPDGKREKVLALEFKEDPYDILKRASNLENFDHIKGPAKLLDPKKWIPGATVLWRRKLNERFVFDEKIKRFEDCDFWLTLIGHKVKCARVPCDSFIYIQHPQQKSRDENNERTRAEYNKKIIEKLVGGKYFSNN